MYLLLYCVLTMYKETLSSDLLFLVVLGLYCCTWAFSSCGEWGLLFLVVCRLLFAVVSLVAEHRLSSCGTCA